MSAVTMWTENNITIMVRAKKHFYMIIAIVKAIFTQINQLPVERKLKRDLVIILSCNLILFFLVSYVIINESKVFAVQECTYFKCFSISPDVDLFHRKKGKKHFKRT